MPQVEVSFDIDANGIVNVSAKDLGTGKEQKITITASSGLSESDIERMVKDAESHSDEDKKRRETVEARNRLDSLLYATEKTYEENRDKLSADDKGALETALAEAKKALDGDDADAIRAAADTLEQASHKLAEAMYRQTQAQQAAGGPQPGGGAEPGAEAGGEDEVIDAEYVDVEEKKAAN
jgi:molecular chaperone DnaK